MEFSFQDKDISKSDIYDDVNSIDGVDIMNSMNSVDSVEEAVVIDGDDDEIVDIPSGALTIGLTL